MGSSGRGACFRVTSENAPAAGIPAGQGGGTRATQEPRGLTSPRSTPSLARPGPPCPPPGSSDEEAGTNCDAGNSGKVLSTFPCLHACPEETPRAGRGSGTGSGHRGPERREAPGPGRPRAPVRQGRGGRGGAALPPARGHAGPLGGARDSREPRPEPPAERPDEEAMELEPELLLQEARENVEAAQSYRRELGQRLQGLRAARRQVGGPRRRGRGRGPGARAVPGGGQGREGSAGWPRLRTLRGEGKRLWGCRET